MYLPSKGNQYGMRGNMFLTGEKEIERRQDVAVKQRDRCEIRQKNVSGSLQWL